MKRIWKYEIPNDRDSAEVNILMPQGAEILSTKLMHNELEPIEGDLFPKGTITLWALIDDLATRVDRKFVVIGTGWKLSLYEGISIDSHVGTVVEDSELEDEPPFIWHVFDLGEK